MKQLLGTQQPPWLGLSSNTGEVVKETSKYIWIEMPTLVDHIDNCVCSKETAKGYDELHKLETKQTTTVYKRERGMYDLINK